MGVVKMAKINKNIKRLRTERNLSQSELASKLFISSQAVSSWENGRTQPDIEMISKLSEVFGVPTEEVIYGNTRTKALEGSLSSKNTLSMVFAILGTLLVGSGLVVLFVAFWDKMPKFIRIFATLVPMLIGQGVAVYTYKRRFDSIKWREGASVAWSIGVLATVIFSRLVGLGVLGIDITSALISALLMIPIMFLFKTASPMLLYLGLSVMWTTVNSAVYGFYLPEDWGKLAYGLDYLIYSITTFLLFAVAIYYVHKYKEALKGGRLNFCLWVIAIFAIIATFCGVGICGGDEFSVVAVLVVIYLLSDDKSLSKPFYPIGVLGLAGYSIYSASCAGLQTVSWDYYTDPWDERLSIGLPISIIFTVAILAVAYVYSAKILIKDKLKLVLCIVSTTLIPLSLVGDIWFFCEIVNVLFYIVAFAQGIVLIISGVTEKKHFSTSIGIITAVYIIQSIISYFADSYLVTGFFFLIGGAALLVSNIFISNSIKKDTVKIESQVTDNE